MSDPPQINFNRLLKLRLVVARYGEMDLARWWNTNGMLGPRGAVVLKRGFPTTHWFAQARVVFAVARSRCSELFWPPGCITLWNLPADLEDQFEDHWQRWLDDTQSWTPFFRELENLSLEDLLKELSRFQLIDKTHLEVISKLRRSAEGRAVPLPGTHSVSDDLITLLAAGFARSESGNPAIPYARLED